MNCFHADPRPPFRDPGLLDRFAGGRDSKYITGDTGGDEAPSTNDLGCWVTALKEKPSCRNRDPVTHETTHNPPRLAPCMFASQLLQWTLVWPPSTIQLSLPKITLLCPPVGTPLPDDAYIGSCIDT